MRISKGQLRLQLGALVAAALLVICVEGCAMSELRASRMHSGGVGFRLVDHWDHSRPYRTSHAPDGTPVDLPSGRPLQIAIWYPAVIGDLPPLILQRFDHRARIRVGVHYLLRSPEPLEPLMLRDELSDL